METDKETVFTVEGPPKPGLYKLQIFARKKPKKRGLLKIPLVATVLLDYKLGGQMMRELEFRGTSAVAAKRGLYSASLCSSTTSSTTKEFMGGSGGSSATLRTEVKGSQSTLNSRSSTAAAEADKKFRDNNSIKGRENSNQDTRESDEIQVHKEDEKSLSFQQQPLPPTEKKTSKQSDHMGSTLTVLKALATELQVSKEPFPQQPPSGACSVIKTTIIGGPQSILRVKSANSGTTDKSQTEEDFF